MRVERLLETADYSPAGWDDGFGLAHLEADASVRLQRLISAGEGWEDLGVCSLGRVDFGAAFGREVETRVGGRSGLGCFVYSGNRDRLGILTLLSVVKRHLARHGMMLIDHADLAGVYEGIREALMGDPGFRFHRLDIAADDRRPGQGIAVLSYDPDLRVPQAADEVPANKNRILGGAFAPAAPVRDLAGARALVEQAVASWTPADEAGSRTVYDTLHGEFPDGASPKGYWHEETDKEFIGFFTWGHDQDFGFGRSRAGAMGTRHLEIMSESVEYGYLPEDLTGLEVLDIGCWTGGDVLALAGLGARVTALEEHPVSAPAAQRLCDLLGVAAEVKRRSLYDPMPEWQGRFDIVYISGVVYHITDPMLALRICFAYLKPGGRIVVETKASKLDGSYCEYAGTLEKGWNWYAPTLEALGRWLVDAGFPKDDVRLHMRPIGRLLAGAVKREAAELPERSGFSRPGSWLEGQV